MKRLLLVFGVGALAVFAFSQKKTSRVVKKSSELAEQMMVLAKDMAENLQDEDRFNRFVEQFDLYKSEFKEFENQQLPVLFSSYQYFRENYSGKKNTLTIYLATYNEVVHKLMAHEPVSVMLKNKLAALGGLLH